MVNSIDKGPLGQVHIVMAGNADPWGGSGSPLGGGRHDDSLQLADRSQVGALANRSRNLR